MLFARDELKVQLENKMHVGRRPLSYVSLRRPTKTQETVEYTAEECIYVHSGEMTQTNVGE